MRVPTTYTQRPAASSENTGAIFPPGPPSSRRSRGSARTSPGPSRRSRSVAPRSPSRRTAFGWRPAGRGRKGACARGRSVLGSKRRSSPCSLGPAPATSTRRSWSSGKLSADRSAPTAPCARWRSPAARIASSPTPGPCRPARDAFVRRAFGPPSWSCPTTAAGWSSVVRPPASSPASGSSRAARSRRASPRGPPRAVSSRRRPASRCVAWSRSGRSATPTATSPWNCTLSLALPGRARASGRAPAAAG